MSDKINVYTCNYMNKALYTNIYIYILLHLHIYIYIYRIIT